MIAKARRLLYHDAWSVGLLRATPESLLGGKLAPPIWLLPPQRRRWWADPFLLELNGKRYVLCEEMDLRAGRGHIACLPLDDESAECAEPTVALRRPYHLSYPYVFRHEGKSYVVPESYEKRRITLYEAREDPPRLFEVGTLVDGFAAVDPTIIRHGDRWWLFCTDADTGDNSVLHLWMAEDPRGPWHPHPGNPIKRDLHSARPAGTPFTANDELIRPAQDCSQSYGGRIVLNRVRTLTATAFEEEPLNWIEPDPHGCCPDGLHTLALHGDLMVIDGKTRRLSARESVRKVKSYLGLVRKRTS